MKKLISVIIAALLCACLTACGSVSLVITEKSTTKQEFDQEEFDKEFYRTSVAAESETAQAEESTEESTSGAKTEEQATTAAPESTSVKPSETAKETQTASTTAKDKADSPSLLSIKITTTTKKYVVDTKTETKETKSDYKYGIKKIDVVSTYYDIYSDGSKVQTDKKSYVKYDTSGYKASTNDLLSEAKSNKAANASEIRSAANKVNGYRSSADKSELTFSDDLCTAASVRATEMAYSGKLSSTRPGGSNYSTVLKDLGIEYTNCIELTCKGYSSGAEAMDALKSKSQNLSLMTSGEYKKIGVGVAKSPDGMYYWSIILTD